MADSKNTNCLFGHQDSSFAKSSSGIYSIRCVPTGKFYIGSSADIKSRWLIHRRDLIRGNHHSKYLQNSWNKYGEENFEWSVVEIVGVDLLIEREQYHLDTLRPWDRKVGFNVSPTANSPLGVRRSPETIAKLREANRNRSPESIARMAESLRGRSLSPEHRAKVSSSLKGIRRSPETRAKMSVAQKKRVLSPESRAKIAAGVAKSADARRGKSRSAEIREKQRRARMFQLAQNHSAETKAKIGDKSRDRWRDPEYRKKMSMVLRGRKTSDETRMKMSISHKKWWQQKKLVLESNE